MNPADNSPLWIRGARVIDPSAKRDEAKGDVFALDGKFVDQLSAADQAKARVIDGTGLVGALSQDVRTAIEEIGSDVVAVQERDGVVYWYPSRDIRPLPLDAPADESPP